MKTSKNTNQSPNKKQPYTAGSVLRYPGGKSRAVAHIFQYFPKDTKQLLSPFIGGGSVELAAASKGILVQGYDTFSPLVEFWQCLLKQPGALADKVAEYFPLAKDKFYELQSNQAKFRTKLERAAVYYVLNRASFSGATLSGGMSPGHPRFTESAIARLRSFYNPNIKVKKADFQLSLAEHADLFAYLDPPYLIRSTLYGKKGNAHKNFDHEGLANCLRVRKNWILSYNDCREIRQLYKGFPVLTPSWKYGMSNNKSSSEILIFSSKALIRNR